MDRIELLTHVSNLIIIASIPLKSRTEVQISDYNKALDFIRNNIVKVYSEYYIGFEKEFLAFDLCEKQIESVLLETSEISEKKIIPSKTVIVDAINNVRSHLSTVSGLLEVHSVALEYFESERTRLEKLFSLFLHTDKSWIAEAFTSILHNETLVKKLYALRKNVSALEIRQEALDKEFRALSRMLGALMQDEGLSERPRVITSREAHENLGI